MDKEQRGQLKCSQFILCPDSVLSTDLQGQTNPALWKEQVGWDLAAASLLEII